MRNRCLLMSIFVLSLTPSRVQAQSPLTKKSQQANFHVQLSNGELLQIPREYSAQDYAHEGMSTNANRRNTSVVLRLPGAKSTIRLKESDRIAVWAELPKKIDPRRIELLKFETRGEQRVTYISAFQARSSEGHWNTLAFRARQSRDGKWLLEPATQPPPGEYCFTLPSGTEHFCFGVDKK